MNEEYDLIEGLVLGSDLEDEQLIRAIRGGGSEISGSVRAFDAALFSRADEVRRRNYQDKVFIRGLIEISNRCRNDCYYCGIRRSNTGLTRYALSSEQILDCCRSGYELGFRTFVMQGGEDPSFTDHILCSMIERIKTEFPDCAITLSLGERSKDSYERLFRSGADRYLLRHEAASGDLYRRLHPDEMSLEKRKRCLWDLKEIGYQVGSGFMVGAPGQRAEDILEDLRFLQELKPDMIGIGPYIHHRDTPFADRPDGSVSLTLRMIGILRLMFPWALLPSTTALASLDPEGRLKGLRAGANVIMPNLSPGSARTQYQIYENKASTGLESAEGKTKLEEQVKTAGYSIVTDRGDVRRNLTGDVEK